MTSEENLNTIKGKGRGKGHSNMSKTIPSSSKQPEVKIQFTKLLIFDFAEPLTEGDYKPLRIVDWEDVKTVVSEDYLTMKLTKKRRMKTFVIPLPGQEHRSPFRILAKIDSRISSRDIQKMKSSMNVEAHLMVGRGVKDDKEIFQVLLV